MPNDRAQAYDDAIAVVACASGERAALGALFAEHGACCWTVARLVAEDAAAAEKAVRAAYLHLWENAETFDCRQSVRGWLLVLTHRLAVRERSCDEPTLGSPGTDGDVAARARAALAALPVVEREALLLAACGGLSERDIAHLTESSVVVTRRRIHAAMRAVRRAARQAGRVRSSQPQRG